MAKQTLHERIKELEMALTLIAERDNYRRGDNAAVPVYVWNIAQAILNTKESHAP